MKVRNRSGAGRGRVWTYKRVVSLTWLPTRSKDLKGKELIRVAEVSHFARYMQDKWCHGWRLIHCMSWFCHRNTGCCVCLVLTVFLYPWTINSFKYTWFNEDIKNIRQHALSRSLVDQEVIALELLGADASLPSLPCVSVHSHHCSAPEPGSRSASGDD